MYGYEGRMPRGWSQDLLDGAKPQEKREQTETETQEGTTEHEEELYYESDGALVQIFQRVFGVFLTGDIQDHLDTLLCDVLQTDPA